jgi:8-oxo-dGTP pyrophosphatase MutT (NUDIX family)
MFLTKDAMHILMEDNTWEPCIDIEEDSIFTIHIIQNRTNPSIEKKVESLWQQKLKEGKILTPDPVFGVQAIERSNNTCILNVYETTYKHVIAARIFQIPDYCEYFLGVRGICFFDLEETKYIIIGERKKETTFMGGDFESVPAGLIEPGDFIDDPIRGALMRELKEELPPTDENDVVRIKPITLKRNRQYVSFDIRYLVELDKGWLKKYRICQHADYLEILPLRGEFPEHESIIGVSTIHLSAFILTNAARLTHSKDAFLDICKKPYFGNSQFGKGV